MKALHRVAAGVVMTLSAAIVIWLSSSMEEPAPAAEAPREWGQLNPAPPSDSAPRAPDPDGVDAPEGVVVARPGRPDLPVRRLVRSQSELRAAGVSAVLPEQARVHRGFVSPEASASAGIRVHPHQKQGRTRAFREVLAPPGDWHLALDHQVRDWWLRIRCEGT